MMKGIDGGQAMGMRMILSMIMGMNLIIAILMIPTSSLTHAIKISQPSEVD